VADRMPPLTLHGVHVRLEGLTASFRQPLLISGTQASLPVPAYTNVLGMISACAGRVVSPHEVRVGFEYRYRGQAMDLQRTRRWTLERGRLREHRKGPGLLRRQFHVAPSLDLYVVPAAMSAVFESPVATPRFGRSEDVAWVVFVRPVSLVPVQRGAIGATLVARDAVQSHGLPLTLAEWFEAGPFGQPRRVGAVGRFISLPPTADGMRFDVQGNDLFHPSDADLSAQERAEDLHHVQGNDLFHPSNAKGSDDAVYLHAWSQAAGGV